MDEAIEGVIRCWFGEMQASVRDVDYERAKRIFAPDVVSFGTYAGVVQGLDRLSVEQWANVWAKVRDFTFRLDELHWGAEGGLAWAACPWDSVGVRPDGTSFARPGRVTLILERRDGAWVAVHTHFSLYPG